MWIFGYLLANKNILIYTPYNNIYGVIQKRGGNLRIYYRTMFNIYKLPNLKVLVDVDMHPKIKDYMQKGLDITSNEAPNPTIRYYD